ncbi:putative RDD family membrane protein YckC [Silvimonas terrae]|uniref:Putative RDD family membrane protein YckC n=1 Tax=Silvimonas terrae TaxID=300266 RepID=A0A840RK00_9NEIS|nr:RDD family protein [Silvimonas terrae]MBB5192914.1 putative RDD family membrane protein YckC [Silvimonas terrae]
MTQVNPYQAPVASLELGVEESGELATRGQRFKAVLVDLLTFVGCGLIAGIGVPLQKNGSTMAGTLFVSLAVLAGVAILIYNLVLMSRNGQTIGKRSIGIRIVRQNGDDCGALRIIFMRALPIALLAGLANIVTHTQGAGQLVNLIDVLLIFRASHLCLHDNIADTMVVVA